MGIGQKTKRTWAWLGIGSLLLAVTAFHYLTHTEAVGSHNVFRRLYYLPIVWAALLGGWRAGLSVAALASLAYFPHAFLLAGHLDPAPTVDKVLEIVLYFGVGGLAGLLVDRERGARRREARAALARLRAENRAERLAGLVHLSRGLAHEIRNPLGGIQGAMEIVADSYQDNSTCREMVEVALRETARLGRVLDDFLSFARPREPHPSPFDPNETVRQVVELLGPQAREKGVGLEAGPAARRRAEADPEQTTQVLINLVRNAIQFTPAGGSITVSVADADGDAAAGTRLRFSVADTGPGVSAELGDAIYDPYTTTREDGTGLGLSISAMLVRQNGGALTHQAGEAGGTTFSFELPGDRGGRG